MHCKEDNGLNARNMHLPRARETVLCPVHAKNATANIDPWKQIPNWTAKRVFFFFDIRTLLLLLPLQIPESA
jgi:hypothetical protein